MADRKAELEKKRKKLEELKKAREQNKLQAKDKEVVNVSPSKSDHLAREREDVNRLVTDLLGSSSVTPTTPPKTQQQPVSQHHKTPETTPIKAALTKSHQVKLVVDQLAPVNIRPKDVEVYAKQTQTDAVSVLDVGAEELEEEAVRAEQQEQPGIGTGKGGHKDDTIEPEKQFTTPHQMELSVEECTRIMNSDDYKTFINRTSLLMERALSDRTDIIFDEIINEGKEGWEVQSSLKPVKVFVDDRWSQNRNVTAMDWSSHCPELLLVSYYTNPNIPQDPDGVALMWDLKFQKETPDYIFNCQSPITSLSFSKFHPSYVIGGTYSGQIVLWDMRSGKKTPLQRSPLSSSAHTHPVYCLDMIGSTNAHNLISISTDGKMCSWNLDMLSQPQEFLELQNRQTRPVAVTCMSFASSDVNKFLVGSEECVVYQGQRHGSKPGVVVNFEGHTGPITAVRAHRAGGGQVDLSHLFLTASFDWTIKLWTSKLHNERQITAKTGVPLCSFENNSEYVYDVKWSPVHPAVFASADGEGRVDIWNINMNSEVPILSETLDSPLSKLCWSPNGHYLACGDCEGKVHLFEAGEVLCSPHPDEWTKMEKTLEDLLENQDMNTSLL